MTVKNVDVLIVGGGTAGCAAAWQAARMRATVLVVEETPWLGGMITSAGVSAFDGNKHAMGSGLYHRLRNDIEAHYGGPDKTFTGWISLTCFEPRLGKDLLHGYIAETSAEVWHGATLVEVLRNGNRIVGALVQYGGQVREVHAHVTVEATEYGDVLEKGGVPYSLGREAKSETGEASAPDVADLEVQDLTWCATLKKFPGEAPRVPAPANYDPTVFNGCTAEYSTERDEARLNHKLHDWDSFLTYSLLPNNKHLLNWPFHSNDSPDTLGIFGTPAERARAFALAKERTLAFVHFMQTTLGHPEWGLAEGEYGTPDHLAWMPYVRESRRGYGVAKLMEADVLPVGGAARAPLQRDSIAIGDYYLDHHHSKMHLPPGERLEENYPDNGPFQVPYGCLVPRDIDGLFLGEKCISVSHIVNGCSRLQPVVMLQGQAIGAAAAICARKRIEPREVDVRELQQFLISEGVAIFQTIDVFNDDPCFAAVQNLGMAGVLNGEAMQLRPADPITAEEATSLANAAAQATGKDATKLAAVYTAGMARRLYFNALWTAIA